MDKPTVPSWVDTEYQVPGAESEGSAYIKVVDLQQLVARLDAAGLGDEQTRAEQKQTIDQLRLDLDELKARVDKIYFGV